MFLEKEVKFKYFLQKNLQIMQRWSIVLNGKYYKFEELDYV